MRDFKFLFIRHGQTTANVDNLCSGGDDNVHTLTDLGKIQIATNSKNLSLQGIMPDKVFFSPTARTIQTRDIFMSNDNYKDLIKVPLPEFRERLFGVWESKPFNLIENEVFDVNFKPEGGESIVEFKDRIKKALNIIAADNSCSLPLVVSHGMAFHVLHMIYELEAPWIHNGDIYEVEISDGKMISRKLCGYEA